MSAHELDQINSAVSSIRQGSNSLDTARFDQVLFDLASQAPPFSGERYTPGAGVQICYEHLHRYLFASEFVSSQHTVLDLGCGIGYGSILLAQKAARVIAVDIDPESTALLQKIADRHQLTNLQVITADIANLDQLLAQISGTVDVVTCHEVIEHISASLQKIVVERIASARSPFSSKTLFFVSTPEKGEYEQSRSEPNPFHLHELSAGEFESLLRSAFKSVQVYEQSTSATNTLRQINSNRSAGDGVKLFELGWQSQDTLIPSLAANKFSPAEYLYAVASNSPLPATPAASMLSDNSNQYVRERLSLASHELRQLQSRTQLYGQFMQQLVKDLGITDASEIQPIQAEIASLKGVIERQARKIVSAQERAERVGAERNLADTRARDLDILVERLKPWHAMGGSLLGSTPEAAAIEVHRLRSYELAMKTPAHRAVTMLGKVARTIFPVSALRRAIAFFKALIKA